MVVKKQNKRVQGERKNGQSGPPRNTGRKPPTARNAGKGLALVKTTKQVEGKAPAIRNNDMQSNNNSQNKSRSGNRPAAKQKGDKQKKKQKSSVKKAKSPKGPKTDKVKPLEKNDKVKHEAIAKKLQVKTKGKEQEEIQKYLECWTNNREQWKFNKMIQVFIQHHVLDEAVINAEMWPMALSYLSGTKGSGKDILVANAKSIIKEVDSAVEGNGDETLQASSKYERARELLQSLG